MAKQYPDLGPFEWNPVTEELTIRGGPFTAPDVLIAGRNAPDWVKAQSYAICTGTADELLINSVIREMASPVVGGWGGGVNLFLYGWFYLTGAIGAGAGVPVLAFTSILGAGGLTRLRRDDANPCIDFGTGSYNLVENLCTDLGGVTEGSAGQNNTLRYWKGTQWIDTQLGATPLYAKHVWFTVAKGSSALLGTVPVGAVIFGADVWVQEAFNSSGADDAITVGTLIDDPDCYVTSCNVHTSGVKAATLGVTAKTVEYLEHFVYVNYTHTGGAPTTGKVLVTIWYYMASAVP